MVKSLELMYFVWNVVCLARLTAILEYASMLRNPTLKYGVFLQDLLLANPCLPMQVTHASAPIRANLEAHPLVKEAIGY